MNKVKNETIWNRNFILLLAINALVFISMHMLSTTIAKFSMSLNGTEAIAGIVAGVFSVTSILIRPVCGVLIDRNMKKKLYIGSIICIFVSILGYSMAQNNTAVIALRLLHGIGWGIATTVGMTMAIDTAPEQKIGECTSVYGLANVLAMAVAPTLGNYLSDTYGYRVMFLGASGVIALALVLLVFTQELKQTEVVSRKLTLQSIVVKETVMPAVVLIFYGTAYSAITTFLMVYAKQIGIENPSVFFSVYSVCILIVRLVSGRIVDTKGPEYILVPGAFFFTACLLLLAGLKNTWMLCLAAICLGFGYSANLSTLMAVGFKRNGRNNRGAVSSTINIGMDLGQCFGSTVAGFLAMRFGYSRLYLFLIIPVLIAIALFLADEHSYKSSKGLYRYKGM